jgi:Leucine-rich repeat (LRR) protein/MinD-like ATPase involved in chromosome partitioning or flagellar assembly
MSSAGGPGQIITFYSYKGGTGRTMALANLACLLAQRKDGDKPILAIDWDLEAPGLHLFLRDLLSMGTKDHQKAESALNDHEGLIDFFIAVRDKLEAQNQVSKNIGKGQTEEEAAELLRQIDFERFVMPTTIPKLYLLKAGRFDADFARRVNTFQWEDLYNRSPWLFQSLAGFLAERYDYVLIDSRTGRTDTSNICTMLLPQKLVVVFTPNRQSLTGVEELVKQATAYRRKSDDFRALLVYPLPSRIENSEPKRRELWRFGDEQHDIIGYQARFEKMFKEAYDLPQCDLEKYFDAVQVQHVPSYAYGEELAVLTERGTDISSLHFRFKTFCDWVVGGAPAWEAPKVVSDKEQELADQLEKERRKSARFRRIVQIAGAVVLALVIIAGVYWGPSTYREFRARRQLQPLGLSLSTNIYPKGLIVAGKPDNQALVAARPVLASLPNLTELDLSGTSLSDVSPLSGLGSLAKLSLTSTAVRDLSPLNGLTDLYWLDLQFTPVSDLSPLKDLPKLDDLLLASTMVEDLTALRDFKSLSLLYLASTKVTDLTPLQGQTNLYTLDVSSTLVSDLTPLKNLTYLHYLRLSATHVSDVAPLKDLTSLEELNLADTKVTDISPLKGLTNLANLDLTGTNVSDLSPLQNLASLKTLNISITKVTDVSPLKGLTNLETLNITGTKITDLSPLKGLKVKVTRAEPAGGPDNPSNPAK